MWPLCSSDTMGTHQGSNPGEGQQAGSGAGGTGLVLGQGAASGEPEAEQGAEGGSTTGRDGRVSCLCLHIHHGSQMPVPP